MLTLQSDCQKLVAAVITLEHEHMRSRSAVEGVVSVMQGVVDRVQQLTAHCNVILVNDGLRDWHGAQTDRSRKSPGELEINAVSGWVCVSGVWCHIDVSTML